MAAAVEEVWEVVVEQYDWYMQWVRRWNPHDAEEVVHEVLLQFVPKVAKTYNPDKGVSLAAWMRIKWPYMLTDYLRDAWYKNRKKVFAAKIVKFSDIGQTFDVGGLTAKTDSGDYDHERALRIINPKFRVLQSILQITIQIIHGFPHCRKSAMSRRTLARNRWFFFPRSSKKSQNGLRPFDFSK